MKSIPLQAEVVCTDGPGGRSVAVLVDPKTLQVTHFAVREKEKPHTQWLVPVDEVDEITDDSIRLRCTVDELGQVEKFVVTEYRQVEIPRYEGAVGASPVYQPQIEVLPVERELIPEGELAVRPGMAVEATDGAAGRVHELVSDPSSGQITHLVLREGHPWGKRDVMIPVSAVEAVGRDALHLALDRETIGYMLAIPVRWRADVEGVELVVLVSETADTAAEALQALKGAARQGDLAVLNAAVLVKDVGGETSLVEMEDLDPRHGALFGAITGGLVGLLGGPIGVVVGAAAGAATGHVAAGRIDMGFPDEYLARLQEGLQPGSSALVTLVEQAWVDEVAETLSRFGGQVLHQAITDDIVMRIAAEAAD